MPGGRDEEQAERLHQVPVVANPPLHVLRGDLPALARRRALAVVADHRGAEAVGAASQVELAVEGRRGRPRIARREQPAGGHRGSRLVGRGFELRGGGRVLGGLDERFRFRRRRAHRVVGLRGAGDGGQAERESDGGLVSHGPRLSESSRTSAPGRPDGGWPSTTRTTSLASAFGARAWPRPGTTSCRSRTSRASGVARPATRRGRRRFNGGRRRASPRGAPPAFPPGARRARGAPAPRTRRRGGHGRAPSSRPRTGQARPERGPFEAWRRPGATRAPTRAAAPATRPCRAPAPSVPEYHGAAKIERQSWGGVLPEDARFA